MEECWGVRGCLCQLCCVRHSQQLALVRSLFSLLFLFNFSPRNVFDLKALLYLRFVQNPRTTTTTGLAVSVVAAVKVGVGYGFAGLAGEGWFSFEVVSAD